jgi:DNA-directed RNA polymerase sigma subunit (sigma70/sigma32)
MGLATLDDNDPVKFYLREVANIPPLTDDEERKLWQQARNQDQEQAELAKTRLIESKLALVVTIAERHSSAGISMLDLLQEGNRGLLAALNSFVESSGDDFSAHAAACIEKAISDYREGTEIATP